MALNKFRIFWLLLFWGFIDDLRSSSLVGMKFYYDLQSFATISENFGSSISPTSTINMTASVVLEPLVQGSDGISKIVQISTPSCSIQDGSNSICNSSSNSKFYSVWDSNNRIVGLYQVSEDGKVQKDPWFVSVGILSLFEAQIVGDGENQIIQDFPAANKCAVNYKLIKLEENQKLTRKVSNCQQPVNVNGHISLVNVMHEAYSQTGEMLIHENGLILETAKTKETYTVSTPIYEKGSVNVEASHELNLVMETRRMEQNFCTGSTIRNCVNTIKEMEFSRYMGGSWPEIRENIWIQLIQKKGDHKSDLHDVLMKNQDILASDKPSSEKAEAFMNLVTALRGSTEQDIQQELREPEHDHILHVLADALAFSSSPATHESAKKLLALESPDILQRYLTSISYASPSDWLIKDMLESCTDKATHDLSDSMKHVIYRSTATLIRRRCINNRNCDNGDDSYISDVIKMFSSLIKSCEAKRDSTACLTNIFGYLENLGSARSIPFIEKYLCPKKCNLDPTVPTAALRVLASVKKNLWKNEHTETLERIYANRCGIQLESSSRSLAAELLLKRVKGQPKIVGNLLKLFHNSSLNAERELFTFTWEKIMNLAAEENWTKFTLKEILREAGLVAGGYNRIAQGGFSASYSAPIFENSESAKYSLDMEFAFGVLKRSGLHLFVQEYPILTFDLFSRGLESMVSEETDNSNPNTGDNAPISTAGMQLGFFGAKQQPVTFFEGQGELMSAVWAADGHEMTAYDGNFLLQDGDSIIPLANGLIIQTKLMAALSLKMTGSIEVSIWNRNSKSEVVTNANIAIKNHVFILGNDATELQLSRSKIAAGAKINFATEVDFYDTPFQMCMKMDAPKLEIRQSFSLNRPVRRQISRKRSLEGQSFVTHPKISRMCTDLDSHSGGY